MSQFYWENEWRLLELKEKSFIVRNIMAKTPKWISFVEKKVPSTLQNTLEVAFNKAFVTVFDKGAALIEKTYNKKKQITLFKSNARKLRREEFNARNVKKFENQAKRTVYKNLTITTIEGIGLGIIGLGIPDIPIFVSVLLKSIYEISISYGFSYTSDREKLFILRLIDASLKNGDVLREKDDKINDLIEHYYIEDVMMEREETDEAAMKRRLKKQIDITAAALAHELLYGKFIQGTTFVGVVGGITDFTCLKRITDYAALKYKRRFLLKHIPED